MILCDTTEDSPITIREYQVGSPAPKANSLMDCFGIEPGIVVVALVGAGGKTSLLYALAREMVMRGKKVVTTTTTKIFPPNRAESPCLLLLSHDPELRTLADRLTEFGHVTVATSHIPENSKLQGINDAAVEICARYSDHVVVEADGAAGRSIKVPEEWEPAIPSSTDLVIPIVGLDCVGGRATDALVFRLGQFTPVAEIREGDVISPLVVGRVLSHPKGGLKGVLPNIPVVPFLNKRDMLRDSRAIKQIAAVIAERARGRVSTMVTGCLLPSGVH